MLTHAYALLDELAAFLALRKEGVQRHHLRQSEIMRATYRAGGAVAVALLIGSLVVGRFLYSRVAAPLAVLASAARRIGGGDLTRRVPEDFDAEFSTLANSFNRMSEGLEELTADLEGRNTELLEALGQVKAAQADLVRAEKLAAMGRMTAGLAHELNNPLASVLGFGELLALRLTEDRDPRLDAIHGELVVPILDEARRAHDLVRSFLKFARTSDPPTGPVRVREYLDAAVGSMESAFAGAGLTLEMGGVPDVHVVGDGQRLREIFLNLINNAMDAMKGAGSGALRITGRSEEGFLVLRFDDEGPGLDQPDRVFEPFFTTKAPGEGTGLGLALVHKFTEEAGGSVRVDTAPGGGAGFELRFRTADAPADAPADRPDRPDRPDHPDRPAAGSEPNRELHTSARRAPRVLVVEDEATIRALHQRILARIGVDILLAPDAAEARRLLGEHEVDLVVSDVKMPGESGLSFFRWVTRTHAHLADRFFFVTGDTEDPEIASLAEENPEMFIRKPFEMGEYTDRVRLFLGRHSSPKV
jgi:signal transduction histidine kinase